jgi:dihydrolipoamide dehydrogenase
MFDLIILGGGPAGYHAAGKAGLAGFSTLLIEKSHLGGVCLNEGCIPSKTLLYSSKLFSQAKNSRAYGVNVSDVTFDLSTVMARKQKLIEMHRRGIAGAMKKNNVVVESGIGHLLPKTDAFNVQVNEKIFKGKRLLICTGAEAVRLPVTGSNQPFVKTNKEILSLDVIPKNLLVVGAGAIGLELASFFAEIGSTVTVVELMPFIGGAIDGEIGLALKRELEKINIRFFLQARLEEIGDHTVTISSEGAQTTIAADIVLMSVGRRPVIKGFGLENINVKIENNAIVTDENGRTTIEGVWAAGDVNGKSMLAHVAYREADVCIDDMAGKKSHVNYDAIPQVIYTHPEVASVGLTQEEAQKRAIDVLVAKLPLSYNGRYGAENENGRGICKAVVDKANQTLLGVHIIGGACSEMIFGAARMVAQKATVSDINAMVFPHPTVSEIIKDTVLQIPNEKR